MSSQQRNPPSAGDKPDATSLLLHLEEYLGRLITLVDGDSAAAVPDISSRAAAPSGPSAPTAVWLAKEGQPPDASFPPQPRSYSAPPSQSYKSQPAPASSQAQGAAADKFLRDLEQLIKAFLNQQQLEAAPRTAPQPPPPQLSQETESRVEVLRKAVAAAEADAAAKELQTRRSSSNNDILQQIDHQWDATLAENDSLKAQLGKANQQQEQLLKAKHSTEQMLREKEVLLGKIRQAIVELKQELSRQKLQCEQASSTSRAAPTATAPHRDKQAAIHKLRTAISDVESQLQRIQAEKRGLEADLQRTHGEKQGLESQLQSVVGEKKGLEANLQLTSEALRTHQNLKQTLEQSFDHAETEVQSMRRLLQQLEVDTAAVTSKLPPGGPVGGVMPPTSGTKFAAAHPSSAFHPTAISYPPATGQQAPTTTTNYWAVETVHSEPPPPGDGIYGYQQHQAPWADPTPKQHTWEAAEPKKPAWEPTPKQQHTWEPIQKQPAWQPTNNTLAVYHMDVPPPHNVFNGNQHESLSYGNSPEWTRPGVQQQQQQQIAPDPKAKQEWNFDPPAEYRSVDGVSQQQQQSWNRDPAAVDGTGSFAYSSTGLLESIEGASYYGSRQEEETETNYYGDQHAWNSAQEQLGGVWGDYVETPIRRTPQEPPMTISTTSQQEERPKQTMGRMAFLQEQMAHAVDDARNNPQQRPYAQSQPSRAKLPLQPAPSPERLVPEQNAARSRWSPHGASQGYYKSF